MFVVYRATGVKSDGAYYGYAEGENPEKDFIVQASRTDRTRATNIMFNQNDCDEDNIKVEILDVFIDEMDAWITRNDYRAHMVDSVTEPTHFPLGIAERAKKEQPEKFSAWKRSVEVKSAKNARQAWAMGAWTQEAAKELCNVWSRTVVVKDLDSLNPLAFSKKYNLNMEAA